MPVTSDNAHAIRSFTKILLPPERLFAAWVEPGLMKTWLFRSAGSEIQQVTNDLRVGGKFSVTEVTGKGETFEYFGEYTAVDRPRGLMFTLEMPRYFEGASVVSIDISAGGEGSWFSFAQTGARKDVMEDVWRQMFRRLVDELA